MTLEEDLSRVLEASRDGRIFLTAKALQEIDELGLGMDPADAIDVVRQITLADFDQRLLSEATGEWMYVFKPTVAATCVYVKIIERSGCVVVSFHADRSV